MEIIQFLQNIDWLFAAVLLIGGRYWGQRYFRITKNNDFNFLAFATLFGDLYDFIEVEIKEQRGNYFVIDNIDSLPELKQGFTVELFRLKTKIATPSS